MIYINEDIIVKKIKDGQITLDNPLIIIYRNFYNLMKLKEFFETVAYCLAYGIMECWNDDFVRKSLIY